MLDREKAVTRLRAVITRVYDGFARPFANDCRTVNGKTEMAQRAAVSFPIYIATALFSRAATISGDAILVIESHCRAACHPAGRFRSITVNETPNGKGKFISFRESSSIDRVTLLFPSIRDFKACQSVEPRRETNYYYGTLSNATGKTAKINTFNTPI